MSDIIRLLPDSVANQIAAGEVIQRPASVIKELVENSVDAGASIIKIYIKDAGRTLIQVVDNGKGMSETDARMAFERHATSKINVADDLFRLTTMGFRGEALPSICAVSQIDIRTRTPESPIGTRLLINGSRVETQEADVCDAGTNIMVKNLFFNVPARRKFLKTDSVENSNILREFERLALVNNNIHLSIDLGSRVLDLRPASFKNRITDIWKNALDLHLLPVDIDTAIVKVEGYISRPEYARRRNPLQYLIVNGRNMRHPYFHKAIVSCYDSLIASDTQPCYFLKFTVDPSSIDVNIHPTKNEIKFENEQEIFAILRAAIKASLAKNGAVPSIDFNTDILPVKPLHKGEIPERPKLTLSQSYNPFSSAGNNFPKSDSQIKDKPANIDNWDKLYSEFMTGSRGFGDKKIEIEKKEALQSSLPGMNFTDKIGSLCIQHASRYLVTSVSEGLIIIHQRRAHIKILYEKFIDRFKRSEKTVQSLMFPELIDFDPEHFEVFTNIEKDLTGFGFVFEKKNDVIKVTGIPGYVDNLNVKSLLTDIVDAVLEGSIDMKKGLDKEMPLYDGLAISMARSLAISNNQKLSADEMEHIVSELFSLPDPMYGPNGKRIFFTLEDSRIENALN